MAALAPERHIPHVLREYALLADGERGILVGPRGDFAWMCFPRWDSPALFAGLIGGGGTYSVTPEGTFVWGGYYEPGTLIWRSRWVVDDAVVECREALALPAQADRAVILRRLTAVSGSARVRVSLDLRADFGATHVKRLRRQDDGSWTGVAGETRMRWMGAPDAEPHPDGASGKNLVATLELEPGQHHDLVLVLACGEDDTAGADADNAWAGTEAEWHRRVPRFTSTAAPRDARHAYAVLCGLTSNGGGMVAAATMSLPERAQEGRSYDYRYVWIRDQCYTGQAVARDGPHALMDDAVRFVAGRLLADGAQLMPAYTVTSEAVPEERKLDLPGYPGGTDVVGNRVCEQFQLDAFGEALLLFAAAARHDHLDADGWRAAEIAAEAIERRWKAPDAGVWELDPAPWTHSRLICAAGLRAVAALQPLGERAARWVALADRIVAATAQRAIHPDGRWQRAETDPRIDAALVLPPIRGALPAEDPRTVATLRGVVADLAEDGYCYRYRPDERPLGEAEGAFLLCGFFLSLAHAQQGDEVAAARWFERNRAACGPPGLLAEEFDVAQRQLRGNLPQAFVHALLLECAASQFKP